MIHCTVEGRPLVLTGLDAEGMDLLVGWLYGNYKQSVGWEQRLTLFHASHRFHIHELQSECERALKSSVNTATYPLLAELARAYNCQELEQVLGQHSPCCLCSACICMQHG